MTWDSKIIELYSGENIHNSHRAELRMVNTQIIGITLYYQSLHLVDVEALKSVLNIPLESLDAWNDTGFVFLINVRHKMDQADIKKPDKKIENNDYKSLYRCTCEDISWMKMCYGMA